MLYPVFSRVGRENLVLRILRSSPNSKGVLSGGIQRRALPRHQSEEMKSAKTSLFISLSILDLQYAYNI